MLLVIAGMIGLGKTTTAEILAEELNGKVFYESVDDNPILPLYYTSSKEEIDLKRYPFLLQLYFLNSRFESLKDAALNATSSVSVIDRSIYEDTYFSQINYDLGRMNDYEFSIYKKLLKNMMQELDSIPKKAPDLLIFLDGSFETVIKRIKSRGRSYELDPELLEYYRLLWSGYKTWLSNNYDASDVLIIDMDKYDMVNNLDDRKEIVSLIKEKVKR